MRRVQIRQAGLARVDRYGIVRLQASDLERQEGCGGEKRGGGAVAVYVREEVRVRAPGAHEAGICIEWAPGLSGAGLAWIIWRGKGRRRHTSGRSASSTGGINARKGEGDGRSRQRVARAGACHARLVRARRARAQADEASTAGRWSRMSQRMSGMESANTAGMLR